LQKLLIGLSETSSVQNRWLQQHISLNSLNLLLVEFTPWPQQNISFHSLNLLLVEFTPLQEDISFHSLNLLLVEFTPWQEDISFHSLNLLFGECVMVTATYFVSFVKFVVS